MSLELSMFSLTETMRQMIDPFLQRPTRMRHKRASARRLSPHRLLTAPAAMDPDFPEPMPGAQVLQFPIQANGRPLRCRVDPRDHRRTMISGSMREVCEALDSMIDDE